MAAAKRAAHGGLGKHSNAWLRRFKRSHCDRPPQRCWQAVWMQTCGTGNIVLLKGLPGVGVVVHKVGHPRCLRSAIACHVAAQATTMVLSSARLYACRLPQRAAGWTTVVTAPNQACKERKGRCREATALAPARPSPASGTVPPPPELAEHRGLQPRATKELHGQHKAHIPPPIRTETARRPGPLP